VSRADSRVRRIAPDPMSNVRASAAELWQRWRHVVGLRPMPLASAALKTVGPKDRRRILEDESGRRFFVDPLSGLGRAIVTRGRFEPEMTAIFEREVKPGAVVLDVGANEGYFTAVAATLVGPEGLVLAVEPQRRLRDVCEINAALNGFSRCIVFGYALGGADGDTAAMTLNPDLGHGASSLVSTYSFASESQDVAFISVETLLREAGADSVDFVKIDVEGFEAAVVKSLLPFCRAGRVGVMCVDYHRNQLFRQGTTPWDIHVSLMEAGMVPDETPERLDSYVIYRRQAVPA
jgi:FkbM family methyltransferase